MNRTYRIRCYACNCMFQYGHLKRHEQTFKHLENVHEIEQEKTIEDFLNQFI